MSKNVTKDSKESQVSIESKFATSMKWWNGFIVKIFRSTKLLAITKSLVQLASEIKQDLTKLKTKLKLLRTSQKLIQLTVFCRNSLQKTTIWNIINLCRINPLLLVLVQTRLAHQPQHRLELTQP